MPWLACTDGAAARGRMHIADRSACALAAALVGGEPAAPIDEALRRDPGLRLWAQRRAAELGGPVVELEAQLAPWLACHLVEALDGTCSALGPTMATIETATVDPSWADPIAGADALLAGVVARLSRLRELESRFQQALETEKLASLAEFAAGAGHEINNPLAVISGRAQLLIRDESHPERRRELALMAAQAVRVHEMIADLMLFARPPQPRKAECDLSALLDTIVAELADSARQRQTELVRTGETAPLPACIDAMQITVALRALGDNALEAVGRGGRVEFGLRRFSAEGRELAEIRVADTGPGLPPEVRRHAFDPFYSGRAAGRGLGMGLAKCWRIVTHHGGTVTIDSDPGTATRFVVTLPVA